MAVSFPRAQWAEEQGCVEAVSVHGGSRKSCRQRVWQAAQKVVPLVQGCSSPCSYTVSLLPALFFRVHCWKGNAWPWQPL